MIFIGAIDISGHMRPKLRHHDIVEIIHPAINGPPMQNAIAGTNMGKRNAGVRGHAAAIGHGIFCTINGG